MMKTANDQAFRSHVEGARNSSRLKVFVLGAIAVAAMAFTSTSAFANCGLTAGAKAAVIKLPVLTQNDNQIADAVPREGANTSIVGLWHIVYTQANGDPFGQSFKEWHSDGTEFENVDHSAVVGNICFGVWKQLGNRTVRLHHTGWTFDTDGNPTGTFTIDEIEVVAPNGMSYTGSFTFKTYDANGSFTGVEVAGTIAGRRITVN
jgi:hypothetical protein